MKKMNRIQQSTIEVISDDCAGKYESLIDGTAENFKLLVSLAYNGESYDLFSILCSDVHKPEFFRENIIIEVIATEMESGFISLPCFCIFIPRCSVEGLRKLYNIINSFPNYSGRVNFYTATQLLGYRLGEENNVLKLNGYEIMTKLGEGGYGTTYLAVKNGKRYAIKQLTKYSARSEYTALQKIGYNCLEHLACPIEILDGKTVSYIVTDYIHGKELTLYIDKENPVKFKQTMIVQLLKAVSTIHSKSVAHNDIKPENIIVENNDTEYNFFLIDFGIACYLENSRLHCNYCGGTLPYRNEECLMNKKKPTLDMVKKNDLFALGVTFFQIIEGRYPYPLEDNTFDFSTPIAFKKCNRNEQTIINDLLEGRKSATEIYESQVSVMNKIIRFFS